MKFFHVYDERYYEGLVKNNFINEDTGYKLMNVFRMPEDKHFNTIAAKGSRLHSLIKEKVRFNRSVQQHIVIEVYKMLT